MNQIEETQDADKNDFKANMRTFRNTPEVENFYRFVSEFALRSETKTLIEKTVSLMGGKVPGKEKKRGRKKTKSNLH